MLVRREQSEVRIQRSVDWNITLLEWFGHMSGSVDNLPNDYPTTKTIPMMMITNLWLTNTEFVF